MTPPIVLTIAGSDPSAGAGIQADLKTISALGAYAATVITAVTTQNTLGVQSVYPLPPGIVGSQLAAVMDDLHPCAIKIGMVHDTDIVRAIADTLGRYPRVPVVYDPVMVSTSGRRLMTPDTVSAIRHTLFPLCTLITPNMAEASLLCGDTLATVGQMEQAAVRLAEAYDVSVLVKGGHLKGQEMCDILCHRADHNALHRYTAPRTETGNLHGTGCTLSSAIATALAQNVPLPDAVQQAKRYISCAIRAGRQWHIGDGNGPLSHFCLAEGETL